MLRALKISGIITRLPNLILTRLIQVDALTHVLFSFCDFESLSHAQDVNRILFLFHIQPTLSESIKVPQDHFVKVLTRPN